MTVREQSSRIKKPTELAHGRGHLAVRHGAAPASSDDLAGADRLIFDLAALVDAGLVVVHESVLGPARYGIGTDWEDAA